MSLADELAGIAVKVAGLKMELERLSARIVTSTAEDAKHRMRIEQGKLMGECLSHRLAMLYKIEDNWPQVLAALRYDGDSRA